MTEVGDCHGNGGSMAVGGDCHGEGRNMAEARDATARQDCGPEEVMEENNVVDDLGSCGWKPKLGMPFDSEQAAYDFYNNYGGKVGFSIRKSECGGRASLGFTKLDQKNYLRSKRQKDLEYGEAGSVLQYFRKKTVENPSFYYAVQLDCEGQITNIFWADAQMIMDYAQFETIIFGAALMYDETAESFTWLFQIFLEAMSNKAPKTIFTNQDAAMAKAIPIVMPNTNHRLCTWHLMQNAVKHVSCLFGDVGVKGVFAKFMHEIDDEEEFRIRWDQMLDRYDAHNNHWLKQTFGVKDKWGWPYVMNSWAAGMSTTQLSESFNACLKDYLNCDHNLMEFFMHFERVLYDKRYKELEAEYNLSQKLPRISIPTLMLSKWQIFTPKQFLRNSKMSTCSPLKHPL
ncbi:hypothetical protein CsSME_00011773 [Camellia sinensis var. sinensis]